MIYRSSLVPIKTPVKVFSEDQTKNNNKAFQLGKAAVGKRSEAGKPLSDFKQNTCWSDPNSMLIL